MEGDSEEKGPSPVQVDPGSIHAALKEFFQPLRTNNTRADFFTVYRKESEEFDRDYAMKYEEGLNTSLIFAGLFSAVSSAFIIDVQSSLQPDPNELTAAYMRILIHAVNGSLFPDADPLATVWTGPPTEIVAVQCLLYASLATSLFAAFVAMLGKQWISRYVRNRGGSVMEKSWDRQRKFDGMEKWNFYIVMEGPPVMLQIALVLLGLALSTYLWSINRAVAGIVMAVTLFGFSFYAFLTIAATFAYNCPYQTPPSLAIRFLAKHISRRHRWMMDTLSSALSALNSARTSVARLFKHLRSGLSVLRAPLPVVTSEEVPLAVVVEPTPDRLFHEVLADWTNHEADARCVTWVLYSMTDKDVILSSVRFAADIILYPAIAKILPPYLLADLLFESIVEGEVVPGRIDQACSAGMALASVLSIQLCLDPECQHVKKLSQRITETIPDLQLDDPTLVLVTNTLCLLAGPLIASPQTYQANPQYPLDDRISELRSLRGLENITCAFRAWMCRVLLQTVWRWRQLEPEAMINVSKIEVFFNLLLKDKDPVYTAIKTTVVLTLAIALGQTVDLDDLYVPDTHNALYKAFDLLHQRMMFTIATDNGNRNLSDISPFLSTLGLLGLVRSGTKDVSKNYIGWIEAIISSNHPMEARAHSAKLVMRLLEKMESPSTIPHYWTTHVPTLLRFLEFCEDHYQDDDFPISRLRVPTRLRLLGLCESCHRNDHAHLQLEPEIIALRHLRLEPEEEAHVQSQAPRLVSVLTRVLRFDDRLRSRALGFELFSVLWSSWPSLPLYEGITPDACARLVKVIGNPLQLNEPQPFAPTGEVEHIGCPGCTCGADQYNAVGILLGLTLSDAWRDHLRPLNFASCSGIMYRDRDRRQVLGAISRIAKIVTGPAEARDKCTMLTKAVDRLKGLHSYGAVQLMLLHIWSSNGMYSFDEESREWLRRETLELFDAHGTEHLKAFAMHIKESYESSLGVDDAAFTFMGASGAQRRVRVRNVDGKLGTSGQEWVPGLQAMCRLSELYQATGWSPGQKEAGVSPVVDTVPG